MVDNYDIFTKGRSHLYDLAIGLNDDPEFNKLITCWPKFKFSNLPKSKVTSYFHLYFVHHFGSKYFDIEKPLLKLIFNNNNYSNRAIVDLNLAGSLNHKFDKLYLDHPTNSYQYQISQWEFEEYKTGIKIHRLHKLKKLYNPGDIEEVYRNANKIIVPSINAKNSFEKNLQGKITYIPFWIPSISDENFLHKNTKSKKQIAFVGIICPSKGIHYLVDALRKCNFTGILHLYGSVMDENYRKYLIQRKGNYEVIFHGHIQQNTMFQELTKKDLAIMPSVSEGLPLSYLQALSVGVPVIASKDSALEEVIGAINTYDTKNVDELAEKIENFFSNSDYQLENIKKNSTYSLDNYIAEWKKILND